MKIEFRPYSLAHLFRNVRTKQVKDLMQGNYSRGPTIENDWRELGDEIHDMVWHEVLMKIWHEAGGR